MKRMVHLAEGGGDREGRWIAPATRQGAIRLLHLLLAGAIVLTVFFLPLSESLKNIGYGVALAAYLAVIVVGGRGQIILPQVGTLLLAILAVALVSASLSAEPREAWRGVWEIFRYTTFFFLVAGGIRGERQVLFLLWAAVAGVGVAATVVVVKALTYGFTLHQFRMLSLGDKSAVGQYLVMMLAVMLGMADRLSLSRRALGILAICAASSIIVLALSNARAMWGALLVVVLIQVGWRRPRLVLPALALFLAVVGAVSLVKPQVAERVAALSHSETYLDVGQRTEIWQSAIRMWRDHPWFGTGPRTFRLYAGAADDPSRARYAVPKDRPHTQAHNIWLHVAAEMGTLGVLSMAAWVVAAFTWLFRHRTRCEGGVLGAAWAGAIGAFAATLVAGMTEPAIGYEHAVLLMGLLGMVMGAEAGGRGSHEAAGVPGKREDPSGLARDLLRPTGTDHADRH